MSNKINWSEVFEEVGMCSVKDFVDGNLTGKQFSSKGSSASRVVRSCGVTNARSRARKAVRRREQVN